MAWTPPSDAVETQASPAPAVNTGWTPPSDAVEAGIELRNPNSITADEYRAQIAAREAKGYDRTISGTALDAGITFLKGAIGLPEAFVGLADIPTLGRAGKLLEQAGYKPKEAKEILDTYLSEAQQYANRQVKETKGFLPTIGKALQYPSTIATTVGESIVPMLGGAGIARGVLKAAPKVAPYLAGAAGEGLLGAGSAAEQMRQEAKDGLLTGKQALSAVGSGVGTAAFGVAGGKLAKKFGLDDIDTMLVGGASQAAKATAAGEAKQTVGKSVRDFALKATASGVSEGVFEEMPQSMQEKMWMNYATDKPFMDGVAEAAGMGLVTGATMGVGATALGGRRRESPPAAPITPTGERTEPMFEPEKFEAQPAVTDKRQALKDALADKIRALAGPSAEETNAPTQEGAKDVTEPISQAGGEGVAIPTQPADNVPPAEGVGGVERDGMVPTGQDVTEPAVGEGTQPAAVTAEEDYANKSLEELENLRSTADQTNDALDIASVKKHFGPDVATAYENMSRRERNRWWNENATEALDRDASTFNGVNEDLLDEYIKAHNNFDTESPNSLGRSVGLLARKIKDPRFVGSPDFVTLRNALAYAKQQGFSEAEVLGGMRERASEWAGADAQELFKDLFKAKPTQVNAPKLEPAATDEEYIPFYGEDLTNKPMPTRLEIQELEQQQEEASKTVEKLSKRTAGTSLFKVLQGSLKNSEMSELGGRSRQVGKNPFMSLVAKKGKPGSSMEDMVDSGALDLFLPEKMRPESPMYDNQESAAYIRKKLIQGQYYTYETQMEIDRVTRGIEDLDKLIQEELSIDDINKEIQLAFDEQREADLDAAQAVPQGEAGSAAKGEGAEAEPDFLKAQTAEELRAKQAEIDRLTKENERLAKEAERKAKADEEAGDFTLTGSDRKADQAAARRQKDIFAEAPAAELETVAISPEQEQKNALDQLKQNLLKPIPPFRARGGSGKITVFKPTPLSNSLIKEILQLASDALNLGFPSSVLGNVKAAGSTLMNATAAMTSNGNLMIAKVWKNTPQEEKLQVLIHELGHSVDTEGGNISGKPNWSKAHNELENWYATSANKTKHPFTYPFHPQFKGKIRPKVESFAQAFGYYFTAPADLQKNAPEAYSQIQAIIERIQDGSQKARTAGTTATGTAGINVQPSKSTENGAIQPKAGEKRPVFSATKGLEDRGAASVTETPEFKRWFGDSKVVDENDEPLVVYRGVTTEVPSIVEPSDTFGASMFGKGIHMTSSPKDASKYASTDAETNLDLVGKANALAKKLGIDYKEARAMVTSGGGAVMPLYASIKNPLYIGKEKLNVADGVLRLALTEAGFEGNVDSFIRKFKEAKDGLQQFQLASQDRATSVYRQIASIQNKDGLIIGPELSPKSGGAIHYMAFEPTQIKSATGNIGTYDPEVADINASISPKEKEKSTWILGRDRLGRVGFGPGAIAYRTIADITNKVLDKLAMKPISPELGRAMRNMKAKVELAKNKVAEVAAEMNTLSPEERNMISDVIEGELKAGVHPPQHVLNIAAAIQSMMSRQSKELVDLGMLSKEAANRWDNKYLPRFYERQLKDSVNAWSKAAKEVFMKQPLMRGIRGSNLRSRGLYEVVGVDDLPNWLSEGWEQRDPKFDPKKSVETVVWRDYTREERENMGEIRDAMFRFVMGYNASQRDIALGRLYKDLAKNYASLSPLDGYVHVPTGNAEGTGAARYGALEGMYVPKEIMDHLSANDHAMAEGILKIYRAGLSKWKEGKTVLNPVSHANNVISNVTMAHFAGVSYWDAHKYAGAIKDLAKNDDMVKEAQEVGLFGGTFSQADLIKSMPPELRAMANLTESALSRFGERIWDTLAFTVEVGGKKFGARPVMQWAYENEDLFFRYVIYRDARSRGMNPEDARDYSQQFIFTYDDLPKGARLLRDYGMPFFSYTYKIVPVLAQTALKYPWRYAAPATVAYTANAMMYAIAANLGGDDDDWWGKVLYKYITDEEFRKKAKDLEANERRYLPEWMKGHSAILSTPKAIRMGVDEATNLPMFLDISRIFPGGDLLDANNNSGGVALIQPLTPSNPVLTSLVAMLGNKDLFLGKDVTNKTDTDEEKAAKRASWLWKQVTPAISVGNYHFDRAMNATANMTGKPITIDAGPLGVTSYTGIGKDGLPVQPKHAMLQTMGIKIRPYDLEVAKVFEENSKRALVREIDFAISKIKRQEAKGVISPEAAEIERQKLKDKKANVKQGLKLSGEEKE